MSPTSRRIITAASGGTSTRIRPSWLVPAACLLAMASPAHAGDDDWDTRFGLPGVTGQGFTGAVNATTVFEGDLVVGGLFSAVGGLAVPNLARYDGTDWMPMGAPFDDEVTALTVWNGELYVGGSFAAAGGTPLSYLARWDGGAWVEVGGVDDAVLDLGVWNGDLVVAGYFGGGPVGVAVFDGVTWDDLDGGIGGSVYAVEGYSGSLYACGEFDLAGGALVANLARWNGSAWSSVGGGLSDASGDPYKAYGMDLVVHDGSLVIAGAFERAGALSVDGIVRWNGSSFSTPGTSFFGGSVNALGVWGSDLVAAGPDFASISLWNGAFWNSLGTVDGGVNTIAEHDGGLLVGGIFTTLNGSAMASLATYDGTWSPLATGEGASGSYVDALHDWNGTVVAGGRLTRIGTVTGSIAAWDGSAWTPLGAGIPAGAHTVSAMATFEDDLIVGGSFPTAGGVTVNRIARWDGATWSAMGTGSLSGVSGLVVVDDVLYANGHFGGHQTLARWTGSDFDPLGTGVSGGVQILAALGSFQGEPVMGGSFTSVDGVAAANVARWDGIGWQPLGSGTNGVVNAVHTLNGLLYVGGGFTTAGGTAAIEIAAWDGASWSALGGGLNGQVRAMASIGTDLYVTGDFTLADGQPVDHVARWDGDAWHALGGGLDDDGLGLVAADGDLWIGGRFSLAGPAGSSRVARWSPTGIAGVSTFANATPFSVGGARPNPFAVGTEVAFTLSVATEVVAEVFDVRGARVRTLGRMSLDVGPHTVSWDGRTVSGGLAPAGVYLVRLRGRGASAEQRVVVVR